MEQMCTAVFAFLESAKPFFQYGNPLQELLPFFVRALGGILPLDALAIVRMEGKKGVCDGVLERDAASARSADAPCL